MRIRLMNILLNLSLSIMLFTTLNCEKKDSPHTLGDFTEVAKCSEFDGKEKECKWAKTKAGVHCTPTANNTCIEVPAQSSPSTGKCEEIADIANCVYYACKVDGTCKTDKPGKCANLDGHEAECKLYEPDAICKWNAGTNKCDKAVAPALVSYSLYTCGRVDNANIRSLPSQIRSVVSSKQGVVYVAGQGNEAGGIGDKATMDRTLNGLVWHKVFLDQNGNKPDGTLVNTPFNTNNANAKIDVVGSLHDGVIIYVKHSKLLGIIDDNTYGYPRIKWALADANIAGANAAPLSFFEVTKGPDHFIYAGNVAVNNGISYYKYGSNVNAFVTGYTKDTINVLTESYSHFADRVGGGLYLAGSDKQIWEIGDDAVNPATPNDKVLVDAATPMASTADLQHDANPNSAIKSLLLVNNTYLLVGFTAGANAGGLFYKNVTDASPWQHTAPNAETINGMIEDKKKPGRAVIATQHGFMIFDQGQISQIVAGSDVNDMAAVALPANAGDLSSKNTAKTGFAGAFTNDNFTHVAQDIMGKFYFASGDGVQTLAIESKEF